MMTSYSPVALNVILFGDRIFSEVSNKMSLLAWVLIQCDWCSYKKRGNLDSETDTHTKKMAWRHRGRRWSFEWNDASSSQGMPNIAGKYQKLEETRKDFPLEPSEIAWPCCQHLHFRLLAARTVRRSLSVVWSHPIFVTLLCKP